MVSSYHTYNVENTLLSFVKDVHKTIINISIKATKFLKLDNNHHFIMIMTNNTVMATVIFFLHLNMYSYILLNLSFLRKRQ